MSTTPVATNPRVTSARLSRHATLVSHIEKAGFWSVLGLAISNYTMPPTSIESAWSAVAFAFWGAVSFAAVIVLTLVPLAWDVMRHGMDRGTTTTPVSTFDGQPNTEPASHVS